MQALLNNLVVTCILYLTCRLVLLSASMNVVYSILTHTFFFISKLVLLLLCVLLLLLFVVCNFCVAFIIPCYIF